MYFIPHLILWVSGFVGEKQVLGNTLTFNIDKDIVNPYCGNPYTVNINVKTDSTHVSEECKKLYAYLDADYWSHKQYDFIHICNSKFDVYSDPWTADSPHNNTKFIFYANDGQYVNVSVSGKQKLSGHLQAEHPKAGKFADPDVQIGVKVDVATGEQKWQFIYCP